LQAGKEVLDRVVEAAPDALLLIDCRGRIGCVNRRTEAMFGYRPDELKGASIETLVPSGLREQHRVFWESCYASPSTQPVSPTLDLRALRKDGSQFPVEISLGAVESGGETKVLVVVRDITDRQQAQEELRLSEQRFRGIFEQGTMGLIFIGPDYRMIRVNPAFCRMLGFSEQELTQMTPLDITHPDDIDRTVNGLEKIFSGASIDSKFEKRYLKKNGEIIWVSVSSTMVRDLGGRTLYGLGMVEDITERKHVEAELRLGNKIVASIEDGLCLVRASDSTIVFVNPKFEKMFGYNLSEMIGKHAAAVYSPTYKGPEEVNKTIVANLARRGVWRGEILNCKKDGTLFFSSVTVSTFDHPGYGKLWVSIHEDVTARKQAERKLRQQAALLDLAQDAVIVRDLDGKITFWNQGAIDTYGWRRKEAVRRVAHDLWQTRFPCPLKEIEAVMATRGHWEGELEYTSRDGKTIVVDSRWSLQRDERGKPIAVLEINRDVTRRKLAEEQLRNVTERLSLATRTASIGIWDLDWRTKQAVWDDTTFEIFGMDRVIPVAYADFARRFHPDDLALVEASLQAAAEGKAQGPVEFRVIRPDGSIRHVSSVAVRDEHDNVVRLVGTAVDITERKEMEEQIGASKEQMAASARLSALGMMAGGVAHEINNPLAIIHASAAELVRRTKEEGAVSPAFAVRNGQRIVETANRITRIIKSLRQLAREGSRDRVRPVSVTKIVEDTLEICKERFKHHSIQLFAPDVDPVLKVDCREVQVGQVLLNLLQNAYDAVVNQAGEKWIRLEVTEDDGSAVFSVIDSGPGVPPELTNKIMEAFFTTKEVGQGVGWD
jgi:PAS domain S-box-containing protein